MNATSRKSYGTIYFPFSVLILSIFWWDKPISFILSILILTLSDPIAAIFGSQQSYKFTPWIDKKSNSQYAMIASIAGPKVSRDFTNKERFLLRPVSIVEIPEKITTTTDRTSISISRITPPLRLFHHQPSIRRPFAESYCIVKRRPCRV